MIQLEVAERLSSHAGEKAYGGLSVFVQAAFEVSRAFIVRRGAFYPQPNVDSAVVVLTPRRPPQALENDEFRALVHAARDVEWKLHQRDGERPISPTAPRV